jgi:Sulfatase-modifying factor enzyme 1/PEGA domain
LAASVCSFPLQAPGRHRRNNPTDSLIASRQGDFYFRNSPTNSGLSNTPSKIDAVAVEREYWETIRNSNEPQDYKDYLQFYPNGVYTAIARSRIKQLEKSRNRLIAGSPPLDTRPANMSRSKTTRARGRAKERGAPSIISLWIVSHPPNCLLYVNGEVRGGTGATGEVELRLRPGTYKIRLSREGFASIEADVDVAATPEAQEVELTLTSPKSNAVPPKGVRSRQGIEMLYIPPGRFMMGSNSDLETAVHEVRIDYSFYMGKYQVTQSQWQAVMDSNPSNFKGENLPVETVLWDDALAFIARLNVLPSEAEWVCGSCRNNRRL